MTDMEIVERLNGVRCDRVGFTPEHKDCICHVTSKAADAIERLIETTDTQELHLGEFELGFRDLEQNNRDLKEQVERLTKERDEALACLQEYYDYTECKSMRATAKAILDKHDARSNGDRTNEHAEKDSA